MPKIRVSGLTMNPRKRKRRVKKNPAPSFGKRRTGRPKGARVRIKERPLFGRRKEPIYVIRGMAGKKVYYYTGVRFDTAYKNAAFFRSRPVAVGILSSIRDRLPPALKFAGVMTA